MMNAWQIKDATDEYDWWWHNMTGFENGDPSKPRSFFMEYFTINPGIKSKKPIVGPTQTPCYAMMKVGFWDKNNSKQYNQFYSILDTRISTKTFNVKIGRDSNGGWINTANNRRLKGKVNTLGAKKTRKTLFSDQGSMSWDLKVKKVKHFNPMKGEKFLNWITKSIEPFEMAWMVHGVMTEYEGEIVLRDKTGKSKRYVLTFDTSCGYQDKNWGRDFTNPWVWLQSSCITTENKREIKGACFVVGGGDPQVVDINLGKKLLIYFNDGKRKYECNFTKNLLNSTTFKIHRSKKKLTWNVQGECENHKLKITATCPLDEMLKVKYENPSGKYCHKNLLNGGTATGTVELYSKGNKLLKTFYFSRGGCEYGKYSSC